MQALALACEGSVCCPMEERKTSALSLTVCEPSLGVCKPAYFEPAFKPENREDCGKKGFRRKDILGLTAWLTLALICVADGELFA